MLLMPRGGRHVAAGSSWVPSDDASIVSYYDPSSPANYTVVNVSGTDYVSAATDLAGSNDLATVQAGPSAGNIDHMTIGTMNGLGCFISAPSAYTTPRALRDTTFTGVATDTFMVSVAMDAGSTFTWRDESFFSIHDNTGGNQPFITFRASNTRDGFFDGAVDFSGTGMPTDGNITGGTYAGAIVVQIVADGTADEVYVYVDGVLAQTYTGYTPTDGFVTGNFVIGGNQIPNRGVNPAGVKFGGVTVTNDISAGNRADHLAWLQQWAP